MSFYKYTKYIPNPLSEIELDKLVEKLKDFFLESGFLSQYFPGNPSHESLLSLYRALAEVLQDDERLPEEWRQAMRQFEDEYPHGTLPDDVKAFFDELIERLVREDYIRVTRGDSSEGEEGDAREARFELTEKTIDFIGHKTLRMLMSAVGRSSFGAHRTRQLATGTESDWHSRPYEFGDTLNLDVNATLLNAIRRAGLSLPLNLEYSDLMVFQTEFHSSCATAILLDCSHSMILYGEDRFTPAKSVTLALAHMIRTRFPGDSFRVILFHDSAEEVPLHKVAGLKIGPHHTNTCEGLRLARRTLMHQKKDLRQIIMVTDGKPSAFTLPDGRIYKNSFGLDPYILNETFKEAANCRRAGIVINTFMLARDYYLVEFVKRLTQISRGKAYLTGSEDLGDAVLMDFMKNKTSVVH